MNKEYLVYSEKEQENQENLARQKQSFKQFIQKVV